MPAHFHSQRLDPNTVNMIDATINHELAFSLFKQIADTYAPSQSVSYTRGRTLQRILDEHIHQPLHLEADYRQTGNIAVMLGETPSALFIAHADEISYLLGTEPLGEELRLTPFCSHRAKDGYPVINLRYDLEERNLKRKASGTLISRKESDRLVPYLVLKEGSVQVGDRVIFDYPATLDGHNFVYGKVDNAAGVTSCVLALIALTQLKPTEPIWFLFPDEEEGPPMGNSMFARGARRFVQGLELPADTLCVVIDGHNTRPEEQPSSSALFVENESLCRGAIVPPHLYAEFKGLAKHIQSLGVDILENTEYVARSDSPALMEYFRDILLLGYHVKDAHFDDNPPCTSLDAIISVAKTIVCMTLALKTGR